MRIIWSNIIPCWVWRADCDPRCIDRARRGVNHKVSRAMRADLGAVIRHLDIGVHQRGLCREDKVHLLELGMDLFLRDLRAGLCAKIFSSGTRPGAYK